MSLIRILLIGGADSGRRSFISQIVRTSKIQQNTKYKYITGSITLEFMICEDCPEIAIQDNHSKYDTILYTLSLDSFEDVSDLMKFHLYGYLQSCQIPIIYCITKCDLKESLFNPNQLKAILPYPDKTFCTSIFDESIQAPILQIIQDHQIKPKE